MKNDENRIPKSESITNDEVQNAQAEKRLTLATPADLICENLRLNLIRKPGKELPRFRNGITEGMALELPAISS